MRGVGGATTFAPSGGVVLGELFQLSAVCLSRNERVSLRSVYLSRPATVLDVLIDSGRRQTTKLK